MKSFVKIWISFGKWFTFRNKNFEMWNKPWLQSSQYHPHNSHNNIMMLHYYGMTVTSKYYSYLRVSQRFESILTLQAKQPDNTTRVVHEDTTSGHSSWQLSKSRAGPTLPYSMSSMWYFDGHPWVAYTLSLIHPVGMVGYYLTHLLWQNHLRNEESIF
jgi:hypothetical protein